MLDHDTPEGRFSLRSKARGMGLLFVERWLQSKSKAVAGTSMLTSQPDRLPEGEGEPQPVFDRRLMRCTLVAQIRQILPFDSKG